MSTSTFDAGLAATVEIFDCVATAIAQLQDGRHEATLSKPQLTHLKKAAVRANRALARLRVEVAERCDRLVVENCLLAEALRDECVDHEANQARVFQLFRKLQSDAASRTTPPTSCSALDRAMSAVKRIDASVQDLDPDGPTFTHGAPWLAHEQLEAHDTSVNS
jgi:hypothetical protein